MDRDRAAGLAYRAREASPKRVPLSSPFVRKAPKSPRQPSVLSLLKPIVAHTELFAASFGSWIRRVFGIHGRCSPELLSPGRASSSDLECLPNAGESGTDTDDPLSVEGEAGDESQGGLHGAQPQ